MPTYSYKLKSNVPTPVRLDGFDFIHPNSTFSFPDEHHVLENYTDTVLDRFIDGALNVKESIVDAVSISKAYDPLARKFSSTHLPLLQQDLISNPLAYPDKHWTKIFGRNPSVNNVYKDIWEGPTDVYVWPQTAQRMCLVSTSDEDSSTGTGTQQVTISYLATDYTGPYTETITLNGLTPVLTTATDIYRINKMFSSRVGSTGYPVGNISLTNTAGSTTYSYMGASRNTAQQAIFSVPAGHNQYISQWFASAGAINGSHFTQIILRSRKWNGYSVTGGDGFLTIDPVSVLNSSFGVDCKIPILIPEKTDIKVSAISDATNAHAIVTASVTGWLEPNT